MQETTGLPEMVRVRAQKGFRAPVEGVFGIVNPGDIVEVPRGLAIELRMSQKAVMTDEPVRRQKDYLPERKRLGLNPNQPPPKPTGKESAKEAKVAG